MNFTNYIQQFTPVALQQSTTNSNTVSNKAEPELVPDTGLPLSVIKAKRQEVEQKLEALLAFHCDNSPAPAPVYQHNMNNTTTTSSTPATDQLQANMESWGDNFFDGSNNRLNSNDWMAFASIMEGPAPTNLNQGYTHCADTTEATHFQPVLAPTPMPNTTSSSAPRVVSSESLNYVVSDRLAEILPELEMKDTNLSPPDEEDHNGLAQFFQDADAWLIPAQSHSSTTCKSSSMPPLTGNTTSMGVSPPSLVRKISTNSNGESRSNTASPVFSTAPSSVSTIPKRKTAGTRKKTARSNRKLGRPSAFPQKLYNMLNAVSQHDTHFQDMVGFTPDGSAFHIYDNDAFVEAILPKYFKMTSFSSFQRQLQLYNFKRVTKGGAYRHPLFHRDLPDNLTKMVRKQSKPSTFARTVAAKAC